MNLLRRRFKIAHLIAEEFAGVITKENQARLEQWRVESPAHAKEYDEIRTYIMTGNEHREKGKQTVKNEWRKFRKVCYLEKNRPVCGYYGDTFIGVRVFRVIRVEILGSHDC